MRAEDQERILTEVESRVSGALAASAERRGASIEDILNDALYHERKRLKDERRKKAKALDTTFWDEVQRGLRHASERDQRALLRKAVRHYAEEIAGNFDDRVYQSVTRILPPALGLLLNAVSPQRLVRRFPELPKIDDALILQGEIEQLKRLQEIGTVILVPTHVSNLDSIIAGYALYKLGLPPFIYGAGLNLFSNPLISFFMHNLGAYTVDRKKTDPLYKDVLKEYATLALEMGYDQIFFPGGTRSRSGAVEKKLKMGLLGSSIAAYAHNLERKASNPKIFIVPATFSFQLVLEAETLIDDFLKEVGKSRYIIEDDEFSKPRTVLDFMAKLLSLDSKIYITISRGLDPFGNWVDADGNSLDPCGRVIDTERYLWVNGTPQLSPDRDSEYTRELGEKIVEAYGRDTVIYSTNVTARAIFGVLRKRNPKMTLLRLLRTGGSEEDLELSAVYRETDRLLSDLRALAKEGRIRLDTLLENAAPEDVVSDGLSKFAIFHTRAAAMRRGDRIVPSDRNLLLYYQNRLEGYGLDAAGLKPTLTSDHRALVQAA